MTNERFEKPRNGYLTDYQHDNVWRKGVKFAEGQIRYYDTYDIVVEGITFQEPECIEQENIILVPRTEEVAWNSRIGIYGALSTEPSEAVFLEGTEIKPMAGRIDDSGTTTRIVFEEGRVSRYQNYVAVIGATRYSDLPKDVDANAIDLTTRVRESDSIVVSGLNDQGEAVTLFEKGGSLKPSQGFVVFHDTTSTCIMFRSGDMNEYAPGYKLYYEDTFTTVSVNLQPSHIRFETVRKNIYTLVRLVALDQHGADAEELFVGRYNQQRGTVTSLGDATFYQARDFAGPPERWGYGADVTFWEGDGTPNDKYLSLKVEGAIRVHCYQHSTGAGIYRVYAEGEYPDLHEMGGLSKFWIGGGPWSVAFRTVDRVDNDLQQTERFMTHIAVAGLGTLVSYSDWADTPPDEQQFQTLQGPDRVEEINCAVSIFHRKTNLLCSSGQVVFHYDELTGVVSIARQSFTDFHVSASIHVVDNTRFTIEFATKPGVEPPSDGYMGITRAVWNGASILSAEGWGTPGGTIWAGSGGASQEMTTSLGGNWRYEGPVPSPGLKAEPPYPDGMRRFRFNVEQRDAAPTLDSHELLYAAPVIDSPYDMASVQSPLPKFLGTAYHNPGLKPIVLITDELGSELGSASVQTDGTWTIIPQQQLAPGTHVLSVKIVFPAEVPTGARLKCEIRSHTLYVS